MPGMIFSIRKDDHILGGDRAFFKAVDAVEISREEFEIRLENQANPLPYEWSPGEHHRHEHACDRGLAW